MVVSVLGAFGAVGISIINCAAAGDMYCNHISLLTKVKCVHVICILFVCIYLQESAIEIIIPSVAVWQFGVAIMQL